MKANKLFLVASLLFTGAVAEPGEQAINADAAIIEELREIHKALVGIRKELAAIREKEKEEPEADAVARARVFRARHIRTWPSL